VSIAKDTFRMNERIRVPEVRLVDHEGRQVGVVATEEALRRAREAGLDLVEVAPNERPPVCRIMDYGKWKYQQRKKLKKHGHEQQLKEVRLRPNTDSHDLQVKLERARGFLQRGDRVQFTMLLRGRERFHTDLAVQNMGRIAEGLSDLGYVERPPRSEGRRLTMVIVPGKPARTQKTQGRAPARPSREAKPAQPRPPEAAPGADAPEQSQEPTGQPADTQAESA